LASPYAEAIRQLRDKDAEGQGVPIETVLAERLNQSA